MSVGRINRGLMVLVFAVLMAAGASAQDKLDSIRCAVASMPDDTAKLSRYFYICQYIYDVDSAGKYSKLIFILKFW